MMDKLGMGCNLNAEYFMDNLQVTDAQYKKFVDCHWSGDDISPDMEPKLSALLVEGIAEVMPGGEAYNGYEGNTAAAKGARSEMRWNGFR